MSRFLFLESLRRWEVRLNPIPARAPLSVKRKGPGGVFRSALPQGVQKTLTRVDHVEEALKRADGLALQRMAQTLAGIEFSSIWPILIETLKDIALFYGGSVVTGAAVGGAVGSLGAGVGAIPGAAAGAAAGVTLGTWLLAIFGLKSLIEEVKDSIVAAFSAYKEGFSLAWKADPHPEPMNHGLAGASHHVLPAASRFADGHVIVLTAILIGIVAWLTRGKGSRTEVLKEIENSPRLGPKVAIWVKENEAALKVHPGLKQKTEAKSATITTRTDGKSAAGTGQSPKPSRQSNSAEPTTQRTASSDKERPKPVITPAEKLALKRKELGLPPAGSAGDNSTVALLKIGEKEYFGVNGSLQKPKMPYTASPINNITKYHAEGNAVQNAINGGSRGLAKTAELWVDRAPCYACGTSNGIGSLAKGLGVERIIVNSPSGTQFFPR